jgi:heat shock protein HtpX
MKRIALFLATNLAVILVASVTLNILGVGNYLKAGGGLDLQALLVFCAILGMAGAIVSLLISKPMAKWSTGTVLIEQPRNEAEQWLVTTVQDLANRANIGMPDVGVFPAEQSNAFATGWNKNNALVAVSAGLLHRFDKSEIRAVLAHEIGHVANGDMVTLALIQGVVNTFVMFFARIIGYTIDRVVLKNENGHGIGFYIATFVAEIILGILASMIVMWFSRQREFRADAMGAQLAGTNAMIGALQRLKAESQMPNEMPDSLTAFGINQGLKQGFAAMFASHPPLDERIQALKNAA